MRDGGSSVKVWCITEIDRTMVYSKGIPDYRQFCTNSSGLDHIYRSMVSGIIDYRNLRYVDTVSNVS